MRKFVSWLIVAFAKLVTVGLHPTKRYQVLLRVRDKIGEKKQLPVRSAGHGSGLAANISENHPIFGYVLTIISQFVCYNIILQWAVPPVRSVPPDCEAGDALPESEPNAHPHSPLRGAAATARGRLLDSHISSLLASSALAGPVTARSAPSFVAPAPEPMSSSRTPIRDPDSRHRRSRWRTGSTAETAARTEAGPRIPRLRGGRQVRGDGWRRALRSHRTEMCACGRGAPSPKHRTNRAESSGFPP